MLVAPSLILGYDATASSNTRLYDPILYHFVTILTVTVLTVTVLTCHRFRPSPFWLSPFWSVIVLTCTGQNDQSRLGHGISLPDTSAPRHFGTRTVRHQYRMVPKCLETIRHQIFTGAELSGHFGTSAKIPRDISAPSVKNTYGLLFR